MVQPLSDARPEIAERLVQAPHLLLGLNFDGTLVPLQDDPYTVSLPASVRRLLRSLTSHKNTSLAIISGRDLAGLRKRVAVPGVIHSGNHGLEIEMAGLSFVEPTAEGWTEPLHQLAADLTGKLQHIPGVLVEDKGLTLSVHSRQVAPEHHEEVRKVVHSVLAAANHPFHLTLGDKVYEIRPRIYWHKGSAVLWIKEQLGKENVLILYLGDDATDEDAFAALPDDITIKVGGSGETSARYCLEGQENVPEFLEWVDAQLREKTPLGAL